MSGTTSQQRGDWERFKRRLAKIYFVFATVALALGVMGVIAYIQGGLQLVATGPTLGALLTAVKLGGTWSVQNIGEVVRVISLAVLAGAIFKAVMNLEKIYAIVSEFNTARSPIAQLQESVQDIKVTSHQLGKNFGALRDASESLNRHAPVIAVLNQRLDELKAQVFQLKVDAVTQTAEIDSDALRSPAAEQDLIAGSEGLRKPREDEDNWEELRAIWRQNIQRLEAVIRDRLAGPRQKKYDNYSRAKYSGIIDKLFKDQVLSETAQQNSKKLHEIFMSHKPRKKPVTDKLIAEMRVLNDQLDHDIGVHRGVASIAVEEVV